MVQELHLRGYQRLRIAPGLSAAGMDWRCAIAPASVISRVNGARVIDGHDWEDPRLAHYTTADGARYFGWEDGAKLTASKLAEVFIRRLPVVAEAGRGSDWAYAGWFSEMLGLTYPDWFPVAYGELDEALREGMATICPSPTVCLPHPPPGEASGSADSM